MTEIAVFEPFAKGKVNTIVKGTNTVVYTRVSSSSQVDNTSLETQRKGCIEYAQRHGLTILKHFGQTHESASNDQRAEFKMMIDFVKKSKDRVSSILVYSLERFSRNDGAIWLSSQLRKLGIDIISATQPIDLSNSSGVMQQKLFFLMGEWDNHLRLEKCKNGIKATLLAGKWVAKPPLGYTSQKIGSNERTIVINEQGRILRNAWIWKAQERLTDEAIRIRLARNGITLCHQRVAEILRNPFYAGLLVHNMLDGAVVQGKHEALVSKELFLQVNGILSENTHGYSVKEENESVPLKRFMRCDKCGYPLAGYLVKKKGIHYYKCSTLGCKVNRNATLLHNRFTEILEEYTLDTSPELLNLLKQQMVATFHQYTQSYVNEQTALEQTHKATKAKIERLEERLMLEEIPSELYYKYVAKYNEELSDIETELAKANGKFSNLTECVELAVNFATGIAKKWLSADYRIKQRIQNLLFPEGLYYNRESDNYRTTRINMVFAFIADFKLKTQKIERAAASLILAHGSNACSVAGSRIELPTLGL